jgi:Leucine-rich repeat (LRR) protein
VTHEVQPAEPDVSDKPKRRWYQFSLKTLLVVLTLFCIGPGGYVTYEQKKARRQKAAVAAIKRLGGAVFYDLDAKPRHPAIRWILGDNTAGSVKALVFTHVENPFAPSALRELQLFPRLRELSFGGYRHVTVPALLELCELPNLKELNLRSSNISDSELTHIGNLKNLDYLFLNNTSVTDAGLVHHSGLSELKLLDLRGTAATASGVAELQKALPHCTIFDDRF